jgi:hypothetical protein
MDFSPNLLYQFKRYRPRFRNPFNSLGLRRFESLTLNREDRPVSGMYRRAIRATVELHPSDLDGLIREL